MCDTAQLIVVGRLGERQSFPRKRHGRTVTSEGPVAAALIEQHFDQATAIVEFAGQLARLLHQRENTGGLAQHEEGVAQLEAAIDRIAQVLRRSRQVAERLGDMVEGFDRPPVGVHRHGAMSGRHGVAVDLLPVLARDAMIDQPLQPFLQPPIEQAVPSPPGSRCASGGAGLEAGFRRRTLVGEGVLEGIFGVGKKARFIDKFAALQDHQLVLEIGLVQLAHLG